MVAISRPISEDVADAVAAAGAVAEVQSVYEEDFEEVLWQQQQQHNQQQQPKKKEKNKTFLCGDFCCWLAAGHFRFCLENVFC